MESPCEWGIDPTCSISHRISKPTEKKSLGRRRRKWQENIRMHLKEIGINTRNCVDFAQDRNYWRALVNGV